MGAPVKKREREKKRGKKEARGKDGREREKERGRKTVEGVECERGGVK